MFFFPLKETHIIESAPHLMPSQLDVVAGDLLKRQVRVLSKSSKSQVCCVIHQLLFLVPLKGGISGIYSSSWQFLIHLIYHVYIDIGLI